MPAAAAAAVTPSVSMAEHTLLTASIPHGLPSQADILDALRKALDDFLPPQVGTLPPPSVTITSVNEKPTGLGNHVGQERLNQFSIALKGGRVEAGVRFQLWAGAPNDVDQAIDSLHAALLQARGDLRAEGFLRITADASSMAEPIPSLNAWRRTAEYTVLYEFLYTDTDGAQSLIAQIPIHTDPETLDSPQRETAVVTDEMVRWDDESAPTLELRGRLTVSRLSILVFMPGTPPTGPVRILRTHTDAIDPPVVFPDLAQFVTAITAQESPARNAQVTFATLSDFLVPFTTTGDPIELGDWDEDDTPDNYEPRVLKFPEPILLSDPSDRLQLVYQPSSDDPQFDQVAIVYLRPG